jgi:hypothetical protein
MALTKIQIILREMAVENYEKSVTTVGLPAEI